MTAKNNSNLAKKILIVIGIITSFVSILSLHTIFFSPFGELPKVEEVKIEKIPDQENAWREYELAIKEINNGESVPSINKSFPNIEDVARGFAPLEEDNKIYLDKYSGAINHIVSGSSRTKTQFQADSFSMVSMKLPNIASARALANLATAQARRLNDEGKIVQAVQLDLAAFKMATDFSAEPHASLIASLLSASTRENISGSLFYLMLQEKIEATSLATIAKEIQAQEPRLLSPYNYQRNELLAVQTAIKEQTLGNKSSELGLPYGLRARIYQYVIQTDNQIFESKRPGLEKWDFKALEAAEKNVDNIINNGSWSVGSYLGQSLAQAYTSQSLPSMKTDYCSRVITQVTQITAATLAYKKTHGKLPENLEIAFSELGLKVPLDFVTSKPVNYRTEGEKATIWFAGIDGKDDGGQKAYLASERKQIIDGKDFIFTLGEMPDWFKEK